MQAVRSTGEYFSSCVHRKGFFFLASAGIAWGGGPLQAFGVGGALACMGWGAGGAWAGNFTYLWGWGLFFRVGGSCGVCSATGGLRPL